MTAAAVRDVAVWWDGPADGATNMAADECLAEEALARGGPVVRLYGWSETTVSLGAFQPLAAARAEPGIAGVALVRRPSGGGAIVHGSDLTYAVAVPREHPLGGRPQALYTAFHGAFVAALADLGVAARMWPAAAGAGADSFFCFDRRAEGDVVVARGAAAADDPKILGSAQRRLAGAIMQHGTVLLRRPDGVGTAAWHAGLADLFPGCGDLGAEGIARLWLERVAAGLGGVVAVQDGGFAAGRSARVSCLAVEFGAARWLARR